MPDLKTMIWKFKCKSNYFIIKSLFIELVKGIKKGEIYIIRCRSCSTWIDSRTSDNGWCRFCNDSYNRMNRKKYCKARWGDINKK